MSGLSQGRMAHETALRRWDYTQAPLNLWLVASEKAGRPSRILVAPGVYSNTAGAFSYKT
jgi:hypothetical protein